MPASFGLPLNILESISSVIKILVSPNPLLQIFNRFESCWHIHAIFENRPRCTYQCPSDNACRHQLAILDKEQTDNGSLHYSMLLTLKFVVVHSAYRAAITPAGLPRISAALPATADKISVARNAKQVDSRCLH